jgi:hypothetical protein
MGDRHWTVFGIQEGTSLIRADSALPYQLGVVSSHLRTQADAEFGKPALSPMGCSPDMSQMRSLGAGHWESDSPSSKMTGNRRVDVLDDEEGWRYELCKSEVEKREEETDC